MDIQVLDKIVGVPTSLSDFILNTWILRAAVISNKAFGIFKELVEITRNELLCGGV